MAGIMTLNRKKVLALRETFETIEHLLGEEASSERLRSAQRDVVGRTMDDFVFSMLLAELTRVVAAQQEEISVLRAERASSRSSRKGAATK